MHLTSKKFQGIVPGKPNSVKVNNGDLSTAITIWKRKQKESNIVRELFDKKFFKKKSVQKREQIALAKYKQKKESGHDKTVNGS
jgi:ribosomal protein S21